MYKSTILILTQLYENEQKWVNGDYYRRLLRVLPLMFKGKNTALKINILQKMIKINVEFVLISVFEDD